MRLVIKHERLLPRRRCVLCFAFPSPLQLSQVQFGYLNPIVLFFRHCSGQQRHVKGAGTLRSMLLVALTSTLIGLWLRAAHLQSMQITSMGVEMQAQRENTIRRTTMPTCEILRGPGIHAFAMQCDNAPHSQVCNGRGERNTPRGAQGPQPTMGTPRNVPNDKAMGASATKKKKKPRTITEEDDLPELPMPQVCSSVLSELCGTLLTLISHDRSRLCFKSE